MPMHFEFSANCLSIPVRLFDTVHVVFAQSLLLKRSASPFVVFFLAWTPVLLLFSSIASINAQSLTWGLNGTGGSGTWNTVLFNWFNGAANVAWASNNIAVFGGTGGNIGVSGTIPGVNGLTFSASGYVLSGGTLSLSSSSVPLTVNTEVASVGSILAGASSGITKSGVGTLLLNGANTYAGSTFVKAGTVLIDTNGSYNNAAFTSVGSAAGDNGTMTVRGAGSVTVSSDLNVGDNGTVASPAVGTLNISNNASIAASRLFLGSAYSGATAGATGTVYQRGGTVTTTAGDDGNFVIGGRNSGSTHGIGTYNLFGGTLTVDNGGNVWIGGYGTGTFNQSGGFFNSSGWTSIARQSGSFGTVNLTGGNFSHSGTTTRVVVGERGFATLTVSGNAQLSTTGGLTLGLNSGATGTVNLNGGMVTAPFVNAGSAGATTTFNFNGGTLRANASSTTFMSGLDVINVQANGAKIDDGGNVCTITQGLLNGGGGGAGGGGLTKTGGGTLALGAASTYTGLTVVSAGTLLVKANLASSVTVSNNATLAVGSGTITMGTLTLNSGSTLRFSLAGPNALTNSFLQVNGNLTLAGQLDLTDLAGMVTNGLYYLIHYNGALTNHGLSVSAAADWNVSIDTSVTNYVRITALARRPQPACFSTPMMQGQDPQAEFKDGYYNLVQSDGCNIHLRRATSLGGLVTAPNPIVYAAGCSNVWAPEIHWISNSWWIYYSVDTGATSDERVHVAQSSGSDPAGPYTQRGVLYTNYWNIDGSVFTAPNGNLYFVCSGRPGGVQGIYIAPMSNPYTLSGPLGMLSVPTRSWEVNGSVNEGPFGFVHDGQLFIVYSASGCWTDDYCLGLLTFTGSDVLSSGSWTKSGPVFTKQPGAYGPGHNALSIDGSGQWWNIYHANNLSGQGCSDLRQLRAQRVFWNSDNTPYFGTPVPLNSVITEDADFLVADFPLAEASGTIASTASCGAPGTLIGSPAWQNPGLKFNGATDYVDCGSARGNDVQSALTLAAWVKPDALADWAGIVTKGTNASPYALQTWHDGAIRFTANFNVPPGSVGGGSWNSNSKLSVGQWCHVAVTCDGNSLRFYVNGVLDSNQVNTNLHFGVVDEPMTIGADLPGGDEYFNGTIRDVRVYGRALSAAEIGNIVSANHAPVFVAVSDQTLVAGQTLSLTNVVSDPDVPPQTLSYAVMTGPSNATVTAINQTNAVFFWRPRIIDSPSTNSIALVVTDNGTPPLSATQNFKVNVARPVTPAISSPTMLGSGFQLNVSGDTGPDYSFLAATNILQTNWQLIFQTNSPALPLQFTDPAATNLPQRFYRIQLGP